MGIIEGGMVQVFSETAQLRLVTLTTAQILALNATPITLLAAPGAGLVNIVDRAIAQLDFNTAAYAGIAAGEDLAIRYTGAAGQIIGQFETTGWLDAGADALHKMDPTTDITPVVNAVIVAHMLVGEIITGDSPVHIALSYRTIPSQFV